MSCQSQTTGGRRRSRKMRGGNGYGVGSPISVGALEYVPNMTSVPNGAAYKPTGGRRRRRGGRMDAVGTGDFVTGDGQLLVSQSEAQGNDQWSPADESFRVLEGAAPGMYKIDYANPMRPAMNDNQEPLGLLPNAPRVNAPSAPPAEGGRRRRRSRRRGGAEPIYAPDGGKLMLQSECGSRPELWVREHAGYPSLPTNESELIVDPMRDGRPLGQCDRATPASAPGAPGEGPVGYILVGSKGNHKGGRRTRRKSKGRRRRSMRGGGSVAGVGYGFAGAGSRGLADPTPYPSNLPVGGDFAIPTGTR